MHHSQWDIEKIFIRGVITYRLYTTSTHTLYKGGTNINENLFLVANLRYAVLFEVYVRIVL